ncbi:MAG: YXWGXW repeat-containing protein [Burkholderiales bacterium]|nr:YXWGXW repeat-containing protein [Burkholderiales bacterium]
MKIAKLAAVAVLSAASVGFSAPVFSAPVSVDIRFGPPAPRYEVVPSPRVGYVWAPGYWDYRSNRYHWVAGNWVRERPGYYYTQPAWVRHDDRWELNRGAWVHGSRDRDHDGVPNRHDRDRDGDGYSNRHDDRPDNPRRH